ncbi:MAG: FHA domain-containing protein [Planctomyces sp.]
MIAQLLPKNGGAPITLTEPITVVGRSAKLCDLVLDHTSISTQHCMLVKTDGLVYIRDLGSTNGTRVNGQRVIRGALLPGDMLSFAGVTYKVHMGPDAPKRQHADNRTDWMPSVPETTASPTQPRKLSDSSQSDVRFLRDSDLLLPD